MEDEKFQIVILGLFFLVFLGLIFLTILNFVTIVKIDKPSECNKFIDFTYEQCNKQKNINLTTLSGYRRQLEYRDGVCIIK